MLHIFLPLTAVNNLRTQVLMQKSDVPDEVNHPLGNAAEVITDYKDKPLLYILYA